MEVKGVVDDGEAREELLKKAEDITDCTMYIVRCLDNQNCFPRGIFVISFVLIENLHQTRDLE